MVRFWILLQCNPG